ncbi:tetratricopeptide-like helical domain, DYW domain protein [Tanacetum coccineum]
MILELLRDAFPHLTALPSSAYEKKFTKDLGLDPRSVRLSLASDGFNPFGTKSTSHSTWSVLLIPYNLPPWICMKRQSFILSSIIPGEKAPGNDIDVYLKPLIKELQLLWKGVDAYDAFSKQHFKIKASLMWTINDFPAYANLSGWSTIEVNHSCQFQKERFDGKVENRGSLTPLTRSNILKQLSGIRFKYGKSKKRTREEDVGSTSTHAKEATHDNGGAFECTNTIIKEDIDGESLLWKKKSDLEYWEHNLLRHNLDVMHIEKNMSDNIMGTLLGLDGKTKDSQNTWLCAEVLDPIELDKMEYQLVRTLCELKQIFRSSFFIVMVHLTIHLIYKAKLGRPVHYRWMYLVERNAHVQFGGRKLGKVVILDLDGKSLAQAHRYVLLNHSKIQPFSDVFLTEKQALKDRPMDSKTIEKLMVDEFPWWLKNQMKKCYLLLLAQILLLSNIKASSLMVIDSSQGGMKSLRRPKIQGSWPLVYMGENFKDDPFIISTQARQVFYIEDLKDVGWSHVIMTKPMDIYDMGTNVNRDDDDSYTQCMPCNIPIMHDVNQEARWRRRDTGLQDA